MDQLHTISITDFLLITAAMAALVVFIGYMAKEDTKLMRRWIKETEDAKEAAKVEEAMKKKEKKKIDT